MKEELAKTKWCPMNRVIYTGDNWDCNRQLTKEGLVNLNCLGSDCMLWTRNGIDAEGWPSGYCGFAHPYSVD